MINRRNSKNDDIINKEIDYPNMLDLKVEKFDYLKIAKENNEKPGIFLKKLSIYGSKLLKVSNSKGYIFTTEEALKLMLHINTFESFKFNSENKYCSNTYTVFSRAMIAYKDVRDVFCFSTQNEVELKIKCLSTNVIFPANFQEVASIIAYMKYHTIDAIQHRCSSIMTPKYKSLKKLLSKYSKNQVLDILSEGRICINEEVLEKCDEVYYLFSKTKISNPIRDLHIGISSDEYEIKEDEIYIMEDNKKIKLHELSMDDWLNSDVSDGGCNSLWGLALCIKEYAMIRYFNKREEDNRSSDEPDMFTQLDEIGRENLINMLES